MRRFMVGAWVVAAMAFFSGCGPSGGSGPAQVSRHPTLLPIEAPPAEIENPEELPPGWYIESGHDRGLMLKNADLDDGWVWIAIEWSVRGPDLQKALEMHRKDFEEDPNGEFLGSGEVQTASLGKAVWSWVRSGEDEEYRKDELVMFVVHPYRPAVLAFRYVAPPADGDISPRLEELQAIAAVVEPVE